ncbi:MAG: hypothetical protein AAFY08_16715, partial [Planctomycetota bacterium]
TIICSDDVVDGRPGPLCMYKTFVELGVYPPSAVIKIDDTEPGIAEGVAAAPWPPPNIACARSARPQFR